MILALKQPMGFGAADSLQPFAQYKFFTPALLYLHGRFFDRPLLDFLAGYKGDCHLLYHRFEQPIFYGFTAADGNTDWNHVLWATETSAWPSLENSLLGATMYEPEKRLVFRPGAQDVTILDPLHMDKKKGREILGGSVTPAIDIVVLGVNSNAGVAAVAGGGILMPVLRFYKPPDYMLQFAMTFFGGGDISQVMPFPVRDKSLTPPVMRTVAMSDLSADKQKEYNQILQRYRQD